MEAVVVDAGSKLLKAGTAAPDQVPPLVSTRISRLPLGAPCLFPFSEPFGRFCPPGVILLVGR